MTKDYFVCSLVDDLLLVGQSDINKPDFKLHQVDEEDDSIFTVQLVTRDVSKKGISEKILKESKPITAERLFHVLDRWLNE